MGMTLFSLAAAMLLISRLVRTRSERTEDDLMAGRDASVWILGLTASLAVLSGFAWFRYSDTTPALICALTLPCLLLYPGTTNGPVRVMGILMVTAGALCLIGPSVGDAGATNRSGARGLGGLGPLIIFDDESRRQELLARVRACEVQLEIRMLQNSEDEESNTEGDAPTLASLKAEVESISRMLETADGASAPTELRLARLEARLEARLKAVNSPGK